MFGKQEDQIASRQINLEGMTAEEPRPRRKRRSRDDILRRIHEAARELFAERGYAATTTREIARLADVSETLLFRHYGDKANLFDAVVSEPFNQLMQDFVNSRAQSGDRFDLQQGSHRLFVEVYDLFEANRELFSAFASGRPRADGEEHPGMARGLEPFFEQATADQLRVYEEAGCGPGFDPKIGLRLTFGLMAAAVLMRDWLFPDQPPEPEQMIEILERMVWKSLAPSQGD